MPAAAGWAISTRTGHCWPALLLPLLSPAWLRKGLCCMCACASTRGGVPAGEPPPVLAAANARATSPGSRPPLLPLQLLLLALALLRVGARLVLSCVAACAGLRPLGSGRSSWASCAAGARRCAWRARAHARCLAGRHTLMEHTCAMFSRRKRTKEAHWPRAALPLVTQACAEAVRVQPERETQHACAQVVAAQQAWTACW
jgi:hypothetical protein